MAFQQGLSGLKVSSKGIDVASHNIANAATVGYKSSRGNFADMYANSMNSKTNVGFGAKTIAVQQQFAQGGLTATSNALDLAISGGGFFVMQAPNGETTYTRNGEFHLDNQGYIINDTGHFLTGYEADTTGMIKEGVVGKIQVTNENMEPNATSKMTAGVNLNSNSKTPKMEWQDGGEDPIVGDKPAGTWNPDPDSYTNTTSVSVYDSLGNPHTFSLYFVKTENSNEWKVYANVDSTSNKFVTLPDDLTVTFTNEGFLDDATKEKMPLDIKIDLDKINQALGLPANGAVTTLDFTLDLTNSTQFAGDFSVNDLTQDGYAQGYTTGLSISDKGIVMQNYSNGESKDIGQVVLASFINEQGLLSAGNNQWKETRDSGPAKVGTANTSNLGYIDSMQIEESNVDLTNELVNLIIFQRNYQANAKSITAQDTILQTVINMN